MKITKITPIVSMPIMGLPWLFVKIDTDEGYFGIGECTDYYVNGHTRGLDGCMHQDSADYTFLLFCNPRF